MQSFCPLSFAHETQLCNLNKIRIQSTFNSQKNLETTNFAYLFTFSLMRSEANAEAEQTNNSQKSDCY